MSTEASKTPAVSAAAPAAANPVAVSKRRSSSTVLLFIAFLAAIGGGGGAWFVIQRGHTTEAARRTESSSAPKYLIHLEGFTVNLADPEETHFLRVTMDLGVDHLPEGADREKMTTLLPVARIRDSILSVLTTCKAESLLTSEGKTQLKKNLVNVLNQNVPELGAREVYFTEFLVQR
jgi:flagellar basal body-associated protein FliL